MMKKILSFIILGGILSTGVPMVYAQQSLKSNFFRNDTIAQSILLTNNFFSIGSDINQDLTFQTNSFTIKFLNGLRQVGYTGISSLIPVTESISLVWLHKF